MDGVNPHDHLDPYTTAEILSSHVTDGVELAKQYRLPSRIRAFITEHHGDSFISFMYQKAVEEAGGDASQVDEAEFRYVGPKPQSRETAILMLADTTEALTRSKSPRNVEELEKAVARAIKIRMEQGQLDECGLTLHDIQIIHQSFVDTLKGLYHSRVEYPAQSPAGEAPAAAEGQAAQVVPDRSEAEQPA
jgi:membrane-associated HD superfamily phosphohydrolase